jgi:hypothetical protein
MNDAAGLGRFPTFARARLRPISEQPFFVHPGRNPQAFGLALRYEGPVGLPRGLVVLGHTLACLADPLQARSIRVLVLNRVQERDGNLLVARILVTGRAQAVWDASSFDMGIITWAERPRSIRDPQASAEEISRTLTEFDLWRRRHGFLVVLRRDAEPLYADLVE